MKICPKCKAEQKETAKFCNKCGCKLEIATEANPKIEKRGILGKKWVMTIVVVLAGAGICAGGGFFQKFVQSSAKEKPTAKEKPFVAQGDYTMIIGHAQKEGTPCYESMEKFAADVEEKTEGHVTVYVHGNSQLGKEKEMFEQVVSGDLQGMRGGQFDSSSRLLMFTLPFLAQTRDQVTALLNSDLAKQVSAEVGTETGTAIINLCDAGGWHQFSNNVHAIAKPDDLRGLTMCTSGIPTTDKTMIALGAATFPLSGSEVYTGLQMGVVDGLEKPWVSVEAMGLYEIQEYFTEVNYQFHPDPFYVNAEWWNSLPQGYRDIISACAAEMGVYNDRLIDENQERAKQVIADAGCEIYVPTEDEIRAFQEAVHVVYDQCIAEGILTEKELKEMQDIAAKASR